MIGARYRYNRPMQGPLQPENPFIWLTEGSSAWGNLALIMIVMMTTSYDGTGTQSTNTFTRKGQIYGGTVGTDI